MKLTLAALGLMTALTAFGVAQAQGERPWYKRPWDPARVQPCDRACLVGMMDAYIKALETKDRSTLPLAEEVDFTENTARLDLGQGSLWVRPIKATGFRIDVADPQTGQIGTQTVLDVQGKPALVAIRLKVERRMITEAEQLFDANVQPPAMELLTTARPTMLADVPARERSSRDYLIYAANAYFDALTGEDGHIAPFADDCVRHEQGYQTVNNKTPGRFAPSPAPPPTEGPFAKFSMMTCEQQVSTGIFNFITRIQPRRLIVDEQKGLVAGFVLFVEDGHKRHVEPNTYANNDGAGMILNMVTMETFGIRGGQIHEIEAFPFVTFQYGQGDGWTPAKAH
ncbi:MAG TPA: hypothetical protein VIJ94_19650 [Caulobacteraceae bacterium]